MNDEPDIEKSLRQSGIVPGPGPRNTVMARYAERLGGARRVVGGRPPFWRRPVPLYATVAIVMAIAVVSFVGGQSLSDARSRKGASTAVQDSLAKAAIERSWYVAPRDLL